MRIRIAKQTSGSALIVVLVIGTLLCIMMASNLVLVGQQNSSVIRSLTWNTCIPIAEAGIEEGITHIRADGLTNLGANGWTASSTGLYTKQRYLGSNYYVVVINPVNPPIITSAGYVPMPHGSRSDSVLKRTVQVTTRRDGLFVKAMVAKGKIDFNGNNIRTDSFDSANPSYSTGGLYDQSKAKDNGDVATNSGLINTLNVGNANVYGHVATGPNGSVAIGPQGAVGDAAWQAGGVNGIEPGWFTDDMNVSFPDIMVPYNNGWSPDVNKTINGVTYDYVLGTGKSQMTDLTLRSSETLYINGDATLYVTGSIAISGNAKIEIGPGATLLLYMGGASASLGGNGVLNHPGNALNFVYLGLPTNTSLSLSGNASFTGSIYAPNAAFTLGGGGNNYYDFTGASVSSTVKMNGHFNFHYDEALADSKWGRGFIISSWDEI